MADPEPTSEWTMGDRQKKSVPQTLRDIEIQNGGIEDKIKKLERWQVGYKTDEGKNIKGIDDQLDFLRFYFKILWVSAGILGTIATILLSWLLSKI